MITGPVFGGRFVKHLGFPWLMRTIGITNVSYCCLLVFLSRVSNNETEKVRTLNISYKITSKSTLNLQIKNELSITDYKSTSVVSSLFSKPVTYKKLEENGENCETS